MSPRRPRDPRDRKRADWRRNRRPDHARNHAAWIADRRARIAELAEHGIGWSEIDRAMYGPLPPTTEESHR